MNDIGKFLKGKFAEFAITAVDSKVNGAEITAKLDEELDKQFGARTSERIQAGPVFGLLKEMISGLFADNKSELRVKLHNWTEELKKESE